MNQKVPVDQLRHGMFVIELDRPWLDTPFLLQGFLIDSNEQLGELRRLCQYVYIDKSRSVGVAAPASDETPARISSQHAQRQGPTLTDTAVRSPLQQNFPLLSRPTRDETPIIYGQKALPTTGLFQRLFGGRKDVTEQAAPPTRPAAYNNIELSVYEDTAPAEKEIERARVTHARSTEILEDIARDIHKDKVLDVQKVNDAIGGMVESVVRNPNALMWLSQLKRRDNYAYGHAIDVSIYMIAFGRHLGFPREQLHYLGISGLLQDVGKIKLPEALLNKTGMLSKPELEHLHTHVEYSLEILRNTSDIPFDVFDTVANHHERYDGSGYPRGLKGAEIGMFGAMAGIVDCFQALISARPYASPISAHQAMQDLYGWRDKFFSGALVEQFIQCLGIFPVGTLVELNTGDVAVVVSQNKVRKLKPQVLLILDPEKKRYPSPALLDLITDPVAYDDQPFTIRRALSPGAYGIVREEYYL